jgi:formylmethanofuran dehydrogenase subunit E
MQGLFKVRQVQKFRGVRFMSETLITCEGCNNEFTEDMIKDWDKQLCEDCYTDYMIDQAESRYDRD